MLTPRVFVTFLVVIEDLSLCVDAHILHRDVREFFRARAIDINFVDLRKLCRGEDNRLRFRPQSSTEEHMIVVAPGDRRLVPTVSGQPFRCTSLFAHHIEVHTSFTIRHECDLLPIGTPHRVTIIGCIGGQLSGLSTTRRNCENVAFIAEGDLRAIRRNRTMAQPQRMVLSLGRCRKEGSKSQSQSSDFLFLHSRIFYSFTK